MASCDVEITFPLPVRRERLTLECAVAVELSSLVGNCDDLGEVLGKGLVRLLLPRSSSALADPGARD